MGKETHMRGASTPPAVSAGTTTDHSIALPPLPVPDNHNRMPSGPGSRPHSVGGFEDARGPHQGSNLSNFYANQRHQTSRGSNEAEQMMQAKRRMAAQRERELRNYHQEQQYNRSRPPSAA